MLILTQYNLKSKNSEIMADISIFRGEKVLSLEHLNKLLIPRYDTINIETQYDVDNLIKLHYNINFIYYHYNYGKLNENEKLELWCKWIREPIMDLAKKLNQDGTITHTLLTKNEKLNYGRMWSENNLQLVKMTREIRRPLCRKYYYDIDICNSIGSIWCNIYENLIGKNSYLKKYEENREYVLEKISKIRGDNNRDDSKKTMTKILCGGAIDNDLADEELLIEIRKEVSKLKLFFKKLPIWNELTSSKKEIWEIENSKMSYIYQTIERELILKCYDYVTKECGLKIGDLQHDGFLVEIRKDYDYNVMISNLESLLIKETGIKLKFKMKDLNHVEKWEKNLREIQYPSGFGFDRNFFNNIDIKNDGIWNYCLERNNNCSNLTKRELNDHEKKCKMIENNMYRDWVYYQRKQYFEKFYACIRNPASIIEKTSETYEDKELNKIKRRAIIRISGLNDNFTKSNQHLQIPFFGKQNKYFVNNWFDDPHRRVYDDQVFIMSHNRNLWSKYEYNCFEGFGWESIKPTYDLSDFSGKSLLEILNMDKNHPLVRILKHLQILCGEYGNKTYYTEYALNWIIASIVFPTIKVGTMVNFIGGRGLAKSSFINLICRCIGEQYSLVANTARDIFDEKNFQIDNKKIVAIEETTHFTSEQKQQLKAWITNEKILIRRLFCDKYEKKLPINFMGSFNNNSINLCNVFDISDVDIRRFFVVKARESDFSSKKEMQEYGISMAKLLEKPSVIRLFSDFCFSQKNNVNIDKIRNAPQTPYLKLNIVTSLPIILQCLLFCFENGTELLGYNDFNFDGKELKIKNTDFFEVVNLICERMRIKKHTSYPIFNKNLREFADKYNWINIVVSNGTNTIINPILLRNYFIDNGLLKENTVPLIN